MVADGIFRNFGIKRAKRCKRLADKMNIAFHVAEDPLHAVARGTGVALKNIDKFNFLIR